MNILSKFPPQGARLVAESDDDYPHVARLNDRWRVITCRDGLQWILQYRNRADTVARPALKRSERVARDDWRGRSYCRTRESLIRCCDALAGSVNPAAVAALEALPDRFSSPAPDDGKVIGADDHRTCMEESRHA